MINFEQIFPGYSIAVQPQRWEAFRQKLMHLSRNAVRAWCVDVLINANWQSTIYMSREELAAKYEGVKPPASTGDGSDVAIDSLVRCILGDTTVQNILLFGSPTAVEAVTCCNWAGDDPTVQKP